MTRSLSIVIRSRGKFHSERQISQPNLWDQVRKLYKITYCSQLWESQRTRVWRGSGNFPKRSPFLKKFSASHAKFSDLQSIYVSYNPLRFWLMSPNGLFNRQRQKHTHMLLFTITLEKQKTTLSDCWKAWNQMWPKVVTQTHKHKHLIPVSFNVSTLFSLVFFRTLFLAIFDSGWFVDFLICCGHTRGSCGSGGKIGCLLKRRSEVWLSCLSSKCVGKILNPKCQFNLCVWGPATL